MEETTRINNIQMILRQTNYTEIEAEIKMIEFDNDPLLVIKDFLGIKIEKEKPIISINQEIYKQLRHKLDSCMRDYQARNESDKKIK